MPPLKNPFKDLLPPKAEEQAPAQPATNPYAAPAGGAQAANKQPAQAKTATQPAPYAGGTNPNAPQAPQANTGAMVGGFINWGDRMRANEEAAQKMAGNLTQQGQAQIQGATDAADAAAKKYADLLEAQRGGNLSTVQRTADLAVGAAPGSADALAYGGALQHYANVADPTAVGSTFDEAKNKADEARKYLTNINDLEGRQSIFQEEAKKAGQYSTGLLDAALAGGAAGNQFRDLADDKFEDRIGVKASDAQRRYEDVLKTNQDIRAAATAGQGRVKTRLDEVANDAANLGSIIQSDNPKYQAQVKKAWEEAGSPPLKDWFFKEWRPKHASVKA